MDKGEADERGGSAAETSTRSLNPGQSLAESAAPPPLPRLVGVVAVVSMVVAVLAVVWIGLGRPSPNAPVAQVATPEVDHEVVVQVHPGDDLSAVGERLVALGVVDAAASFASAARAQTPPIEAVLPGFYVVSPGLAPADMVAELLDPRRRVGFITVEAGRQLDDVTDPATGVVRLGLLAEIAQATCVPTGGGQRCLTVEELRQSAAQSDVDMLGIPDWARDPVAAMAGHYRRLEGLIGVGQWNFDPTATPAQVLATLIAGSVARYDLNSLLSNAAAEHGVSPYQVLIVASLLQRDDPPGQYRRSAIELYDRLRSDQGAFRLPLAPVIVPGAEALAAAEHPNG